MAFRKLSASRGAGWIVDGFAVFRAQPKPFLTICLAVGLLMALPVFGFFASLMGVVFYGGLVSALHTQARGGTPQLPQAFDGFNQPGALPRLLVILALNLALGLLAVLVLALTIGPDLVAIVQQAGGRDPDPQLLMPLFPKIAKSLLLLLPLGIVVGWVTMLAVPRAMLDGVSGGRAIADAFAAMLGNLGAMFVNLLCLLVAMTALLLVLFVPLLVVEAINAQHRFLGMLLQIPLTAAMTGAIYGLYTSMMYQAWREIFADGATPPPAPGQIEI